MQRTVVALLLMVTAAPLSAAEPWPLFDGAHWNWPRLHDEWARQKCWCPNDYQQKPLPRVGPNAPGCVDDYCRKSIPTAPPVFPGCVDDYCAKNCPLYLRTPAQPWYQCGSPTQKAAAGCPGCAGVKP